MENEFIPLAPRLTKLTIISSIGPELEGILQHLLDLQFQFIKGHLTIQFEPFIELGYLEHIHAHLVVSVRKLGEEIWWLSYVDVIVNVGGHGFFNFPDGQFYTVGRNNGLLGEQTWEMWNTIQEVQEPQDLRHLVILEK